MRVFTYHVVCIIAFMPFTSKFVMIYTFIVWLYLLIDQRPTMFNYKKNRQSHVRYIINSRSDGALQLLD